MERVRIIISGYVQRVFFRAFVKDKANNLGLTGCVKNTKDEKVEVIVEGHETKIRELIEFCKEGPPGAIVKNIEIKKEPHKGEFKEFIIKY